jgi:hypothetical protein
MPPAKNNSIVITPVPYHLFVGQLSCCRLPA